MNVRSCLFGLGILGAALITVPAAAKAPKDSSAKSKADADKKAAEKEAADKEEAASKEESESTEEASKEEEGKKEEANKEEEGSSEEKASEEDSKESKKEEAESADTSPIEKKGETYRFVGARYRLILVPEFMIGLFADGGTTVAVHSFGPEFAIRKDDFEYDFSIWYAAYSMDPTPFKAKSDGEEAWELVESRIKVLYFTVDFLWSHPISPQVALNYGMGAGLGLVFGPLYRNQAYRVGDTYQPCTAPGNPDAFYCGADNNHYNNYEEPNWGGGGSKPVLFPWFAVQTGLRYKPHKNFAGRLDLGFGLSGFFFGLGADYGLL